MLKVEEVSSFIEQKLNEIASTKNPVYNFNLFADFGKITTASKINGLVKTIKGDPGNVAVLNDIEYIYSCELLVPSSMSNNNIINIKNIIDEFINVNNGCEIEIGNGTGIFTFSTALAGDYKSDAGLGDIVPVQFNINIKYTLDVLTASKKHWFLDGFEIPFISEGVYVDKEGIIQKISGKNYSKTLITGQTKYYKFQFPFDTKNQLCVQLQRDLLNGDLNKQYELKYFDGVSFIKDEPFVTTVSIYKNGDANAQILKTSQFNITFADVDDGKDQVKYYLGLCDTVFDASSENTRYFENSGRITAKMKQQEYWEEKINEGCVYEQIKCPNLQSLTITQQVYSNTHNYELFDLVNKNYAVIKIEQPNKPTKYFYYFITNATIGANNQVMYDLKLDTIQTYFFEDDIKFSDCLIERAHLNRFVRCTDENGEIDPEHVKFDGGVDSKLFLNEPIGDSPKHLVSMQKIKWNVSGDAKISEWINSNIAYWVYIFIDPTHLYNVYDANCIKVDKTPSNSNEPIPSGRLWKSKTATSHGELVENDYSVLAYPIYKNRGSYIRTIKIKHNENYFPVNNESMEIFEDLNNDASFIYSKKISIMPPFVDAGIYWSIDNHDDLIMDVTNITNLINPHLNNQMKAMFLLKGDKKSALFGGIEQSYAPLTSYPVKLDYDFSFNEDEVKAGLNDKKYNPKILSMDNTVLKLKSFTGAFFDYDLQKLNSNEIIFLYNETIQPEISKYYCRVKAPQGLYVKETSSNFLGLVDSVDMGVAISNDQYQLYLANNKNAWLQSAFQIVGSAGSEFGRSMVAGSEMGVLGGLISGTSGIVSSLFNRALTIDNMKESPDSLKHASGNALYSLQIKELGMYVEIYTSLDGVLNNRNDFNKLFGYECDFVGNLKQNCNIRKYFNYIKAKLNSIDGVPISNFAREDLKARFERGVRFWNNDNIEFNMENYEKWIDGIQI